ncbi:uncharacterized protein E0L32_007761 [Thyridium curvatum]|uniref:alpha-galactosidase n=1 Tax=Thyridium curvatum TaxID=1093900 RepID=A0A507B4M4_9PEZI|nr:uncharacterized protein E0L32_007761 [Thyridium curvatum]TPX11550.1 hypothetical protein E0L32_007761 [Thyridium curvatum]
MGSQFNKQDIIFGNDAVKAIIRVDENGAVFLDDIVTTGTKARPSASRYFDNHSLPLAEIRLTGEGNHTSKSSKSLVASYIGKRLQYRKHQEERHAESRVTTLDIEMYDDKTQITVTSHLTVYDDIPVVRSSATVRNDSDEKITVSQVSSLVVGGLARSKEWWNDYVISEANNTWFREAQWKDTSLPDAGIDDFGIYGMPDAHFASIASYSVSNHGTFSTQGHLPMGMLKRRDNTETWLWQIENNGSWRWEIGDYKDNVYLAASGPNATDHEWWQKLSPGDSFTSVTAAVCHLEGNADTAFAALTQYRRRIRRPHEDNSIFFNDYMNCLMGDPSDEKVLALVDPVAKSGAEYFVIDCGWYADDSNWWDDVGEWEPSKKRFPMGFEKLLGKIREKGLKPGLWIEPEVIGVRSIMAKNLPDEAFFQRDGKRILEKNRYHLDFRHPAVIKRMDEVIDRLVNEYGACYLKFDYNVEIVQGTDVGGVSGGVGQLDHNRAYLAWVGRLLDRHKDLVIENCSSGAQRMDYASLAVHTLQSTSDQQDPVRYAAIAAAIPTAVIPEQGATWAYPQPDWSDETNAMTVVNSLLGRIHLSGRLDIMPEEQLKLIYDGMKVYQGIRGDIPSALPFWPLGLPKWHDDWLSLGLMTAPSKDLRSKKCYVSVWRRGGQEQCSLPISPLKGEQNVKVELLYPAGFASEAEWDATASAIQVRLSPKVCARLYCLQVE